MKMNGVTLVEITIALLISSLIAIAVFFLLKNETFKRAQALSRTAAKNEAVKIFAILEGDLRQARLGSFKSAENGFSIKIPSAEKPETQQDKLEDVLLDYKYSSPKLVRMMGKENWNITRNLTKFKIVPETADEGKRLTGQVEVTIETLFALDGLTLEQAKPFEQQQVITMREDSAKNDNPHWRDFASVADFSDTGSRTDLLKGLKENSGLIVKPIDLGVDLDKLKAEAGDLSDMSEEQRKKLQEKIADAESKLNDAKSDVDKQLVEMNRTISNQPADVFVDLSKVSKARSNDGVKKEAGQVRDYLTKATTVEELEDDMVQKKAKEIFNDGWDDYDKCRKDVISNFAKGKRDLLKSMREIDSGVAEIQKLKNGLKKTK